MGPRSDKLGLCLGIPATNLMLILQHCKKVIEGDFRMLQDVAQGGSLNRAMSRHRDFDQFVGQLLLKSDMASALANHGES